MRDRTIKSISQTFRSLCPSSGLNKLLLYKCTIKQTYKFIKLVFGGIRIKYHSTIYNKVLKN